MKTCPYCGNECLDNAASCPACRTEFSVPRKEAGGPFHRPPRPEAATIVLRTFARETPAQQALAAMRAARIEAFIATDDCGGLLPPLGGVHPFRLVVSEVHREAAEQVLADMEAKSAPLAERMADTDPIKPSDPLEPPAMSSTARWFVVFVLGVVAGALLLLGYQRRHGAFSGTVERDFNDDGRTDGWDTYVKGQLTRMANDENGDQRPDLWCYYNDLVTTKWEADSDFDGKVDVWGKFDGRGVPSESTADLDFDGKPDATYFFQFGLLKETHYTLLSSGLVWKRSFYTNGLVREEWLDRNRDGKFDEKLSLDVYGVEVSREQLK